MALGSGGGSYNIECGHINTLLSVRIHMRTYVGLVGHRLQRAVDEVQHQDVTASEVRDNRYDQSVPELGRCVHAH